MVESMENRVERIKRNSELLIQESRFIVWFDWDKSRLKEIAGELGNNINELDKIER